MYWLSMTVQIRNIPEEEVQKKRRIQKVFSRSSRSDILRKARSIRPGRRHVRIAVMATVPPAALFGFGAMQQPAPADKVAVTLPMSNAAKPLPALAEDSMARIPEASPAALEASYYGNEFAGRPTANGEIFNPELRTAAHRTLPFGTVVKVTDALTGKATLVKINDRGPFHGNREIDLSTAAARDIGMIAKGTAKVMLEVVRHA